MKKVMFYLIFVFCVILLQTEQSRGECIVNNQLSHLTSIEGWYNSDSLKLVFEGFEGSVIVCISDSATQKTVIQSSINLTKENHSLQIDIRDLKPESYHIELLINSNQEYDGYFQISQRRRGCCEKHRNTPVPNHGFIKLKKKSDWLLT